MEFKRIFEGVYLIENKIATENLVEGKNVYGEKLIKHGGREYRLWDPFHSKLSAAIKMGLGTFPLKKDSKVLYLGAATGTTTSHISDIVREGVVFCVEFSPRSMKELLKVCETRKNMVPILEDARKPENYDFIGKVDVLYEDLSQSDQVRILILNAEKYLKKEGYALFAIKSQCIDVIKEPEQVYEEALREAGKKFEIMETYILDPFEKEHMFAVMKFRG